MKPSLTVSLPENIKSELKRIASEEGLSQSEIVRKAIQDYLFIRKFRKLRNQLMAKAQAQGVFTDEDVFNEVS